MLFVPSEVAWAVALCCSAAAADRDGVPSAAAMPQSLLSLLVRTAHEDSSSCYRTRWQQHPHSTCLVQHIGDDLSEHHPCFNLSTEHVSLGLICESGLQAGWQGCIGVANTRSFEDLADKVMLLFCAGLQASSTVQQGWGGQLKETVLVCSTTTSSTADQTGFQFTFG
jgi:hypothetical protein